MTNVRLQGIDQTTGQNRLIATADIITDESGNALTPTSMGGALTAVSGAVASFTYFGDITATLGGTASISLQNDVTARAVGVNLPAVADTATFEFQFLIPDTWSAWTSDAFAVRWRPFSNSTQKITLTLKTGIGGTLATQTTSLSGSSGAVWTNIITAAQLASATYPNGGVGTSSAKNQALRLEVEFEHVTGGTSMTPKLYDVTAYFTVEAAGTFGLGTINRGT